MFDIFRKRTPEEIFWKWFSGSEHWLFADEDRDAVSDEIAERLDEVTPGLMGEAGPERFGKRELVLSADGDRELFAAVEALVAAAPPLKQWTVTAFRQPKDLREHGTAEEDGVRLSVDDVWFSHKPSGGETDLEMYVRGLNAANEDEVGRPAFVLLERALGEVVIATRVNNIGWHGLPDAPEERGLLPLRKIVDVPALKP